MKKTQKKIVAREFLILLGMVRNVTMAQLKSKWVAQLEPNYPIVVD